MSVFFEHFDGVRCSFLRSTEKRCSNRCQLDATDATSSEGRSRVCRHFREVILEQARHELHIVHHIIHKVACQPQVTFERLFILLQFYIVTLCDEFENSSHDFNETM